MALIKSISSAIGWVAILALLLGVFMDVRSADRTKDGYQYPFSGWSDTPIDFSAMYQTN